MINNMSTFMYKVGSKYGFKHKRFCVLDLKKKTFSYFKSEDAKDLERELTISATLSCELKQRNSKINMVLQPENEKKVIFIGEDDVIKSWFATIKALVITEQFSNDSYEYSMNNFEHIAVIGRGAYGKVSLCREKDTEQLFAIKSMHKQYLVKVRKEHTAFNEKMALVKLKHPFFVQFYFAFQTPSKIYIGLEYISGGDLFYHMERVGHFSEFNTMIYIAETAIALNFLHSRNMIYRDLKTENVLLDKDGHIKLSDFGLIKNYADTQLASTFCGTPYYVAPEMIQNKAYNNKVDWWSLGVLMYELLYGRMPFQDSNGSKLYAKILKESVVFPTDATSVQKSLINGLLEKDPSKRLTFNDIKVHPFFRGIPFEHFENKMIEPTYVPKESPDGFPVNFHPMYLNDDNSDSEGVPLDGNLDPFQGFSFKSRDAYQIANPPRINGEICKREIKH